MVNKGQAWSLDIALAVIIFMSTFFLLYAMTSQTENPEKLQIEAERISKEITSEQSNLSLVKEGVVDETKILELINSNYNETKQNIRAGYEFCIYFEDEEGNLILLNVSETQNISGIGSEKINVSGIPCR